MRNNGFSVPGVMACPTTIEGDMAAFDDLPPMVRARLREAPFKVASEPLLKFWRSSRGEAASRHQALLAGLDRRFKQVAA